MTKKQSAKAILMAALLMIPASLISSPHKPTAVKAQKKKSLIQIKLERYIGDDYIAECISKTKYPYIIAAIAKAESDYRPQVVGDNGRSHGLFQIQPQHWGNPGDMVEHQTAVCERIIGHLIVQHGLEGGIRRYNGNGAAARSYARRIIKIAREIENG